MGLREFQGRFQGFLGVPKRFQKSLWSLSRASQRVLEALNLKGIVGISEVFQAISGAFRKFERRRGFREIQRVT